MTADYTIQATPRQVAAVERDGFLVVAGPTTKPCPECGGGYLMTRADGGTDLCPACNGDGTVPIVVEVVVPERECLGCSEEGGWGCSRCVGEGRLPARTLLRGTAEAVPVVDDPDDLTGEPQLISISPIGTVFLWPEGESGPDGVIDVTDHFADAPRPEVGDTAWIIRGEGS